MKSFIPILFVFVLFSCSDNPKELPPIDINKLQENLLEANKLAIAKEAKQIEEYIAKKDLKVIKTETGLRYQIYNDVEGETIKKEQNAVIRYTVTLLDGSACYSTGDEGEQFTVGKDYVESGLHEGIKFLSVGDKAIIIIPSHLAHGLAGDLKKIPFRSTIVYDIELVAIK